MTAPRWWKSKKRGAEPVREGQLAIIIAKKEPSHLVPRRSLSLPVCQVSLPRLANSVSSPNHDPTSSCVQKKHEFASLPRFLRRGDCRKHARPGCLAHLIANYV